MIKIYIHFYKYFVLYNFSRESKILKALFPPRFVQRKFQISREISIILINNHINQFWWIIPLFIFWFSRQFFLSSNNLKHLNGTWKKNLRHYKILHPSFKKEKINSCASIHEYFFQRFAPTFFHENRKAMLTNIHSYANDITWGDTLKNLKAKVSAFRARGGDKRRSSIRGSLVRWRKMHPGYA